MSTVSANLLAAADVVENGWCVGHLVKDGDKYCAVDALAKVITGSDETLATDKAYDIVRESEEGEVLAKFLAENHAEWPGGYDGYFEDGSYDDLIYDWNDRQTDKSVVVETLREVAAKQA